MYDQYYELKGRPFQLTPDPHFYFESATHRKALSYLGYGLAQGEGFIVITGDIGAGKTTLTRAVARGLGINVTTIFALTFAFGSGLAGLGGALGAAIFSLDPQFPLKFMIYFLVVIAVGGTTTITGPFFASILLGVADVAGKYYTPTIAGHQIQIGGFVIYTIMVLVLIFRPQGLFGRAPGK